MTVNPCQDVSLDDQQIGVIMIVIIWCLSNPSSKEWSD